MDTPEVPLEQVNETIEEHAQESTEPWVMGVALTGVAQPVFVGFC